MSQNNNLTVTDRFTIFEQLNMHQRCIDKGWGREQVDLYNRLYWPEGLYKLCQRSEIGSNEPLN